MASDISSSSSLSNDSELKDISSYNEFERQEQMAKRRQLCFAFLAVRCHKKFRSKKWSPPRLIWTDYVTELNHQNEFNVTFRMSLSSFCKLADLLRAKLTVDGRQANRSSSKSGSILSELVVAMSLRWLAGGQWQDIKKRVWNQQVSLFYLRHKFLDAVLDCSDLEIRLPDCTDIKILEELASQFEAHASQSVFRRCVGELDGLTVLIKAPTAAETEDVLAYYTGQYKDDCLNV